MRELLFTEHPDNKIEIEKSGHKYRVEQYFGTFTDEPMGSLYYFIDEKLAKTATISKPLNSDELTKELLKLIAEEIKKFCVEDKDDLRRSKKSNR